MIDDAFEVTQENADGCGHITHLLITHENDGALTILVEQCGVRHNSRNICYNDAGAITLSADQIAALRQWLIP